ncbi:AraC-type DNA-binding protein [Dyadobacter soli]|uniref:AraC-type DNA-binding protein n=1 Tax=Dyadobacter soli TaxID=659014 RepID=A0A1G7Q213_9BACT|nr:helix-turn-helix domain-containing protein [Dyadobacter soli]SDF92536.1 AraC-type DNA-binding protein [Dyadobacter soli]
MGDSIKMISNSEYKRLFLPGLSEKVYVNNSRLQLYRIEDYLRNILIPVLPYRTTFNFIIFVTKGRIKQQLEISEYEIVPGSVLLIRQGSITRTLEIAQDTEGFFIVFENEMLSDSSLDKHAGYNFFKTSPFASLSGATETWLSHLLALMELELGGDAGPAEVSGLLFKAALMKIMVRDDHEELAVKRNFYITLQFKELVQQYHQTEKKVLFYANKLSISENYLCKCIKETTGKPPKQWIVESSILHSQVLLQNISKDISSIAFELNFQSVSYFTRQFRQVTGISPSEFRLGITANAGTSPIEADYYRLIRKM